MKRESISKKHLVLALAICAVGILSSCKSTLHNPNDWAFRKGASPEHVPLQVSKKVYR